jgi:cation/acetate symporter
MVGAGALIKPLLGFSHATGVITVGAVVILIVTTAGMVSTTYVQFIKGSLLVVFSTVLVVMILNRGLNENLPADYRIPNLIRAAVPSETWPGKPYHRFIDKTTGQWSVYDCRTFALTQTVVKTRDGQKLIDGLPQGKMLDASFKAPVRPYSTVALGQGIVGLRGEAKPERAQDVERIHDLQPVGFLTRLATETIPGERKTGSLGPLSFLERLNGSVLTQWNTDTFKDEEGNEITVYTPKPTPGRDLLRPGNHPTFKGIRGEESKLTDKLNFLSLMLALFGGTASLPHILIRYYTVKDQASARKSTIVGIASIGFFYVLTLYIGLGAMTSGALDVTNSNMAAPLLAKSFGEWLFAIISAIAFTTVLGTVSGLIIAASGAVAHDICGTLLKMNMTDTQKIRIAKIASIAVGLIAIVLGILFEKMNVSYLVGWAFSVAASANLPSLIMLIFWPGTTKQGITASITVGVISSLSWILLSADTFKDVYGIDPAKALVPFSQPGIVTIPLGFAALIGVSLLTRKRELAA